MKKLLSLARQAADQYNMIQNGDRILVAVSGGKDSILLVEILNEMRKFYPKKYEIEAVTISAGFSEADFSQIREFFKSRNIKYHFVKTEIDKIFEKGLKNPCSLCSRLRRGALIEKAAELGCGKIALGHHRDDVNETFFMSLLYEGRINCFAPLTKYTDRGISIIRPLIYVPEALIKEYAKENKIPVFKNPCPADKSSKRAEIRRIIDSINKIQPGVRKRIFTAVSKSEIYGWKQDN